MKHRKISESYDLVRKPFRLLNSHRRYQIMAASAAFLAVTAVTGALAERDPAPAAEGTAPLTVAGAAFNDAPPPQAEVAQAAPAQPAPAKPSPTAAPRPPASKVLDYEYQAQPNYYWCGPAATRIALTARDKSPSQDSLASKLGTTVNGTNSAHDTTRVLNSVLGTGFYRTHEIPGPSATPAQMDQLQADVVRAVSSGYGIVANIVGGATDTAGGWHVYDGGHYVAIVGYKDDGRMVKVADPANPYVSSYWMTTIDMANWMASRGYSA